MKKQSSFRKEQEVVGGQSFFQKAKSFFEQSQAEMKKVVWPTRKEIIATSWAVLLLVGFMGIYLGLVDLGLVKIIATILS